MEETSSLEVDVLIGCDLYWELITGNIRCGDSGPVAIQTRLGWVLSGPAMVPGQHQSSACFVTHTLHVESFSSEDARTLDDRLRSFWNLEAFGIDVVGDPVLDDFNHKTHFT